MFPVHYETKKIVKTIFSNDGDLIFQWLLSCYQTQTFITQGIAFSLKVLSLA